MDDRHRGAAPAQAGRAEPAERDLRLLPSTRRLLAEAAQGWLAHGCLRLGASIAFYAIFALAPLLLVAIAMATAVFGADAARGAVFGELAGLVGGEAARTAQTLLESAWREDQTLPATLVAIATLLVGATGVFVELRNALDTVWHGAPAKAAAAWTLLLRARLAAFALVLAIGFLAIVSLLLSAALSALAAHFGNGAGALLLRVLETVASTAVLVLAFALLLRWLPSRRPSARMLWVSAIAAALLFAVGKNFIGMYLGRASFTSAYGAAGSFIVLIMWIYYSAQLLLVGAELGRAAEPHARRAPRGADDE